MAARLGWIDLNEYAYTEMNLASYEKGARVYTSTTFLKSDLRIAFGEPGYLLYGNGAGAYYWCGGPASYTDAGTGQINRPAGAPTDCKGHGALGSGWDFSSSQTVNQGLTLCGADAVSRFMSVPEAQRRYTYPAAGAAYAIWVR